MSFSWCDLCSFDISVFMMRTFIIFILLLISLLFSFVGDSGNQAYFYEPSVVTLFGKVYMKTFPGRPNYEDIKAGDELETHWILNLESPISVVPKEGKDPDGLNDSEENIRKIQIVIMSEYRFRFRNGQRYKISGSLFHAISGHHHTPVLIELKKAEEAK